METSHAEYEQATGCFEIWSDPDDGGLSRCLYMAHGYAGRDKGKNDPASQSVRGVGPLPTGAYRVGRPVDHPRLGPLAFPLEPFASNNMEGRSGFYIHGDSRSRPGNASHGCIILNRAARDAVAHFGVRALTVTTGLPDKASRAAGTRTVTK